MDWVHCNTCAAQPSGNGRKLTFRLTSCGHIFCQNCMKEEHVEECQNCKNKDVTTMQLTSQMKPEIKMYFEDPQDLLAQLTKTMEFQKTHRMRFIQLLNHKNEKYNRAKVYINKLEQKLKQEAEVRAKLTKQLQASMRELEMLRGDVGGSSHCSQYPAQRQMNIDKQYMNPKISEMIRNNGVYTQQSDMSPFSAYSSSGHDGYHRYREPPISKESIGMTPSSIITQSPYTPVNNNFTMGDDIQCRRMPFGTTPTSQLNAMKIVTPRRY